MFKNSNKAILAAVGAALLVESGRADVFTVSFTNTVGSLTYGAGGVAFSGTQPGRRHQKRHNRRHGCLPLP
jgi:hypothetical protein